jgi:phenylalanyl-tRNA synthetase alpha chain
MYLPSNPQILTFTQIDHDSWALTAEGKDLATSGSHEAKFYNAVPDCGIEIKTLQGVMGDSYGFGQGKAFKNKWVKKDGAMIVRIVCFF